MKTRTPSRRLKSIAADAKKKGLIPVFHLSRIRVNPKTGAILKGEGRNVLIVYDKFGTIVGERDANSRYKTNNILDKAISQYITTDSTDTTIDPGDMRISDE